MTLSGSGGDDLKMSVAQFPSTPKQERVASAPQTTDIDAAWLPSATDGAARRERADAGEPNAAVDIPAAGTPSQSGDNAPAPVEATPLPKAKPDIKPVIYRPKEEVCDILTRAAQRNDLPVPFFIRLLFQESHFSPGVVSNAGAQGIAQFMPATASEWGVDNPFDPLEAIPASARLLRNLFEKFGNLGLAAAAYNAGPKRIQDWLAKKASLPQETQGYVKTITGKPAENWRASENGAPAVKLPRHAPCQEAAGLLAWNGPDEIPTPVTAPHRRPKDPDIVVAKTDETKHDRKSGKEQAKSETKDDVTIARRGGHMTAVIKVADASGKLPNARASRAKDGDDEPKTGKKENDKKARAKAGEAKTAAKTKGERKEGKGALQLAARMQSKKNKKLRVSAR
jgi:soluble lytic murein transglycosylase-like protein